MYTSYGTSKVKSILCVPNIGTIRLDEKLPVPQLVTNSPPPHFMELQVSSPCLQEPSICRESSPCPHPILKKTILISFFHRHLGLPSGRFPSGLPAITQCATLMCPICSTCPTHIIVLDFITGNRGITPLILNLDTRWT